MYRLWAALGLSIVALVAWPSLAPAAAPAVERAALPNGVTVLTRHRPGSQVVAAAVAVRAGARYETASTSGAARLLESTLTLGTERRPTRDALLRAVSSRGGRLDVSAGREVMEVNTVVSLSDIDLGLDVLFDAVHNSRFDDEAVAAEREVILHGLDEREDDPEATATDRLFDTVFEAHPLAHRPTGSRDGVGSLPVEQLRRYWRSRLTGPNTVIAVVSGLEHADVLARLASSFGGLSPDSSAGRNDMPLAPRGRQDLDVAVGAEQSYVLVGVPVPGVSEDRAPLRAVRGLLGRSSGRLYAEIRDRRGLAYATSAVLAQYGDAGLFYVYAGTEPSNARLVAELLERELGRLREEPVSEIELREAVGNEIGSQVVDEERSRNEAITLARAAAFGLPTRDEEAAALRAVTVADVQRVANCYLDPSRLVVVISHPAGAEAAE